MMVVGAMKLFAYEKFKAQSEKDEPAHMTPASRPSLASLSLPDGAVSYCP
jgi:hypothetical protein